MLTLSLSVNVLLFTVICTGLVMDARWARVFYGQQSPARRVMLSVYLASLLVSLLMLLGLLPMFVLPLLMFQIAVKLFSPIAFGTFRHPIVIIYLCVATLHSVTLYTLWPSLTS
jgi:hypothetical protein